MAGLLISTNFSSQFALCCNAIQTVRHLALWYPINMALDGTRHSLSDVTVRGHSSDPNYLDSDC